MKASGSIFHSRLEETPEAKVRWFRSLSMSERMEMLCSFTDLAMATNPSLQEREHAQPILGRVQVISPSDLIASKSAVGRAVDLEDVRLRETPESGGREQNKE
jgi:hypothetical protein